MISFFNFQQEIIQNADDARATEVKFYLDCRNLSTLPRELVESRVYNELDRFQGPALMSYNNAPFKKEDWESIQNLQRSGKADNPHKVGKFGIGFNSVYHITGKASFMIIPCNILTVITMVMFNCYTYFFKWG